MTSLLLALLTAQVQPAVRRATPASDDPGQVVRQAGTVTIAPPVLADGGYTVFPSRPAGDYIDAVNSTTTPLGLGATWTGASVDVLNYVEVSISVMTDRAGTLTVSFSPDGTNWDSVDTRAVAASTSYNVDEVPEGRYYKAAFTNGGVGAQSFFRLQSILRPRAKSTTQQQVNDAVVGTDVAALTKGLIVGLTTGGGGGYVPVKVNPSGTLTVDASNSTGLAAACTQSGQYVVAGRNNAGTATDFKVFDAGSAFVMYGATAALAAIEVCATNAAGGTSTTLAAGTTSFRIENQGPNAVTYTLDGTAPVYSTTGQTLAAKSGTESIPADWRREYVLGPTVVKAIAHTAAQTTGACVQIQPYQ